MSCVLRCSLASLVRFFFGLSWRRVCLGRPRFPVGPGPGVPPQLYLCKRVESCGSKAAALGVLTSSYHYMCSSFSSALKNKKTVLEPPSFGLCAKVNRLRLRLRLLARLWPQVECVWAIIIIIIAPELRFSRRISSFARLHYEALSRSIYALGSRVAYFALCIVGFLCRRCCWPQWPWCSVDLVLLLVLEFSEQYWFMASVDVASFCWPLWLCTSTCTGFVVQYWYALLRWPIGHWSKIVRWTPLYVISFSWMLA